MRNFKFPLYAVRKYVGILVEGNYRVIQTAKSKYILDVLGHKEVEYSHRRLDLLRVETPYELYPLNRRYSSISQMVEGKDRVFIDSEGKLVRWVPKTFHRVTSGLVILKWTNQIGHTLFKVQGCDTVFTVRESTVGKFARYINVGVLKLLFDTSDTELPNTRVKL